MKLKHVILVLLSGAALTAAAPAQVTRILIPAGTPEDAAIQEITKETDADKRLALLQEFLQKFAGNPAAVAYGNLQISQYYSAKGDNAQALAYGDKALAAAPNDLEILGTQANLASQMKDYAKVVDYAARGGMAFQGIAKEPKPADMSEQEFAARIEQERDSAQPAKEYVEGLAVNAIASEPDNKQKVAEVEKFEAGFPKSKYEPQVVGYAVVALQQMNDPARLAAYGQKAVAANPDNASLLSVLASALVDTSAYFDRAMEYARKAIALAKADAPGADTNRKLAAGTAHTALGFGLMKQEKNTAAITELKTALVLLKEDPVGSQKASYFLAYAYAKTKNYAEARQILNKLIAAPGPFQQPARELLAKVGEATKR
ncbi:MAG TPA: tetratricopeptide repeat protein [Terriglobales bacterium]|jgi:tetratricopeptide (TPR) repeat protein|nr:tetratricopeptide repeat protein [Terriglobales bacterium]